MSETKSTPGPWSVRVDSWNQATVLGPKGELIAPVAGPILANADLIAACPDLLAALEYIVSGLEKMTTNEFATGGDRKMREQARAAIAKAKGD